MARTPSTMLPLGTPAPDFSLPEPASGKIVSLKDFVGRPLVVMFICNHCPYVKHIAARVATLSNDYHGRDVDFIAINSNDVNNYPDDSPEKMVDFIAEYGIGFPYLYDESQAVAKIYRAACTPDLYLFDVDHKLVYRGQFDASRPGNDLPVSGADLEDAIKALLAGIPVPDEQVPSLGCNIKWQPGNEPDYYA